MMWKTHHCHFSKKILVIGNGFTCPVLESKCHIVVREVSNLTGSVQLDDLKDNVQNISEFTIGWPLKNAVKLLEELVITMKEGEVSQFNVSKSLQLLSDGASNGSKDEEREYSVILELVSFEDATPLWKLVNSERYELALNHKNEGSKLFQEGKVQLAFFHYSLSMKYLISVDVEESEPDSDCRKLKCICYLNLAACQLKYENYQCVIKNCSKALNIDGGNVKALYRRAVAYKEMGRNSDARSDLLWAKKHEPRNREIHKLLQSLSEANS